MENNNILGTTQMVQIALVVHDIEKTSQAYADFFGIEKPQWKMTDVVEKANTNFRGKETEARAKLAFINLGAVSLELIEPDKNPSTWREILDEKGEGFHHIAFNIAGMKDRVDHMEKLNMPLVQKAEYTNGRYAYIGLST